MILSLKEISKSYKKKSEEIFVLDKINLDIKAGETIALTGESGAGKSTLLHIAGLLDTPDSGEIILENKIINSKSNLAKIRNKTFGFVFQSHYLLNDFNALENIMLPLIVGKTNLKEARNKAEEIIDIMTLSHRKHHYPSELSGGEQQRIALARALINNPKIIFADEPTGNLDPKTGSLIIELIIKLNKTQNQTFVIVTHDLEIANKMDKHYSIKDKKIFKN